MQQQEKCKYSGNRLIEHRFIQQTAYSCSFDWKKQSKLFPAINYSLTGAGIPFIRAVRRVGLLFLNVDEWSLLSKLDHAVDQATKNEIKQSKIDQFVCAKEGQEWTVSTTTATVQYIMTKILQKYSNFSFRNTVYSRPHQFWVNVSDLYVSWSKYAVGLIIHKNDKKRWINCCSMRPLWVFPWKQPKK